MPSAWCDMKPCAFRLSHKRRLSVVLVGSSSEILLTRLGRAIDRHDTIVRTNCAPVRGFEEHVGSRTSFRVINEQSEMFGESVADGAASIVALPMRAWNSSSDFARHVPKQAVCRWSSPRTGHHSAFIDHDLLMQLREEFGVIHPTTGFAAIALFSRLFTRPVALHGYSFFAPGTRHYWVKKNGTGSADLCGMQHAADQKAIRRNANMYHNSSRERDVIMTMVGRGMVTFLSTLVANNQVGTWLRGGWRHAWGDSSNSVGTFIASSTVEHGVFPRQSSDERSHGASERDLQTTCLTACVPRPGRNPTRERCRWPLAKHVPSSDGGDAIVPSSPAMLATGCLPSPPCCVEFNKEFPRNRLFMLGTNGSFRQLGRGVCHQV
mmetsp:Transcript_22372/g.44975  ORF Transcript_22372/g.44975 Transcript_22372/m.44975 type:complete len:379 (-) Transcript_22372:337-1473(-)